jgi:hypothetical protein
MAGAFVLGVGAFVATASLEARQQPASDMCRINGLVTGLGGALPGASITVRKGDAVQGATSSGVDGTYRLTLPDGTYTVAIELTGFARVEREVTVAKASAPCTQDVDAELQLVPRTAVAAPATQPGRGRGAGPGAAGAQAANEGFETLAVTENAAAASLDVAALERSGQPDLTASNLLPPGFGSEALADAVAFTGDAARVDRGMLNDRRDAINRGDFQPFGDEGRQGGQGGFAGGGFGADGGTGNFQFNQGGGRGGRGNQNNNQLGGRGVRQRLVQGNVNYGFSGSALNQAPLQFRSEVRGTERPYSNHNFGFSVQTPVKIPGIFENPNNSTRITFQYSGSRGGNMFDQYATVPSAEMRTGDFSAIPFQLIDPQTGQPFPDNKIPAERISEQARLMAAYYPAANLPGTTRNYHFQSTTQSVNNSFNVTLQHNFSGQAANSGGGRGGGGNNNGGRGNQPQSNAGRAGQGRRLLGTRTNVNMSVRVQYQEGTGDQLNVFSALGGDRENKSIGINPSFNIQRGRIQQQLSFQFNKTDNRTVNHFSGLYSPSAEAGIQGISGDPLYFGLPRLTFSSMTGLTDVNPSLNASDRFGTTYSLRRPIGTKHQLQIGGDFQWNRSVANTSQNPNGAFTFTGLYTSGGLAENGQAGRVGFDYADFLLGMPQQATVAFGSGSTTLTGRTMGIYIQDDWRMASNMTLQMGVRYDLLLPFVEENGHLVNLDVNDDFTGAESVQSGQTGSFSGAYPAALIQADRNNVSPNIGLAWRAPGGAIIRPSYSMAYNNGTYSGIAQQLARQPPFATTGTNIGTLQSTLLMENALLGIPASDVTNNYGIDMNYVIGSVNRWNVDIQRQLFRTWNVQANYSHTRGSALDVVRAPNRNPDGTIRIDGVQPFYWTSSEGRSELNSVAFRVEKRESNGISYSAQYTLAKSRDNAPSGTGGGVGSGGGANVAQNDQDLEAEWAISNFDQRHAFQASMSAALPWGQSRPWLSNGGWMAAIVGDWNASVNFTMRSGSPTSVTVSGASRDIATGLSGVLRANYNGEPIEVENPTIDNWFNTSAFSRPDGTFGNSSRNIIYGPGSKGLNATFRKRVQLASNRNLQFNVSVSNILSLANYSGLDTNVNSLTFGQVRSVSGHRTATVNLQLSY